MWSTLCWSLLPELVALLLGPDSAVGDDGPSLLAAADFPSSLLRQAQYGAHTSSLFLLSPVRQAGVLHHATCFISWVGDIQAKDGLSVLHRNTHSLKLRK